MNGVDTNVLVYAFDASEPVKQLKAQLLIDKLVADSSGRLLWQALGEFVQAMRRWHQRGRISESDVRSYTENLLSTFPVVLPTIAIVRQSLTLSSKYSLSHWDSMILAACIDAGIDTLYSEDLTDGMLYESVRVVNPVV